MAHVNVLGSINLDLALTVDRIPQLGETILATGGFQGSGGKGFNQAMAAHRCGADTQFHARVGRDAAAHTLRLAMDRAALDARFLEDDQQAATGTAHIFVTADSDNAIVVNQGANANLSQAAAVAAATGANVLLMQLEIPLPTVRAALAATDPAKTLSLLNAAPAVTGAQELFDQCDIVIVNETEAAFFGGVDRILAKVRRGVILTLGSAGATWYPVKGLDVDSGEEVFCPAFKVDAVDTTGAGDAFCGALAAELSRGAAMPEALEVASAAGAITTMSQGAQSSALSLETISDLKASRAGVNQPQVVV